MLPSDRRTQIRGFEPADLDEILRLFRDTVRTVNRRDYSAEQVAAWAPTRRTARHGWPRLAAPWTLVAVSGETISGFGQLRPDGRVDYLYVHAEHQREGIGSLLLARLIESAQAHGLRRLTVEASITARPFFERHCFATLSEQRVHRRGVDFVNFLMDRAV